MSIDQPAYEPWPTPPSQVEDYPEPVEPQKVSRDFGPFLIVLVTLAILLFMISVVLLAFTFMQVKHDAPVTMPASVTTTVTATPVPAGDAAFLASLHFMGYPVPDPEGAIKIGRGICVTLESGHGIVPKALDYVNELGNAPEGFNQADAIALIWASEDAFCPDMPRQ